MNPTFESDDLRRLLADYYNLTGIKICLFDAGGNEILYYPERYSPFCACLRGDADMEEKCLLSDRRAIEACRKTGKSRIYTCHAGLTECIAPVLLNGEITGYIAIGQIREKDSVPASERYAGSELSGLWKNLPVIGRDRIHSALHVLEACAAYEQLKAYVRDSSEDFRTNLTQFVREHIGEDLGVERLCSRFRLSRTELYRRTEESLSVTPAGFVREQRLLFAADRLLATKDAVGKICASCGIEDYNYFSKLFKKRFGVTPREYRKREWGKSETDAVKSVDISASM